MDIDLDRMLYGTKWLGPVSYSFTNSRSDYGRGYPSEKLEGYRPLNLQEQFYINEIFGDEVRGAYRGFSVEGFTRLNLDYLGNANGGGTIRFGHNSSDDTASAYPPDPDPLGGDVWFGNSGNIAAPSAPFFTIRREDYGTYDHFTLLHEIGHALGLKHPHEEGATSDYGKLPTRYSSFEYTVMSYSSHVGADPFAPVVDTEYPQTYMMLDIAALQSLYGADFTTNSGDTVYRWGGTAETRGITYINGKIAVQPVWTGFDSGRGNAFLTIWDGGGTDTYDLSNFGRGDLRIDLRPGEGTRYAFGSSGSDDTADLGDGFRAGANFYNALLYRDDPRSLIENAIGADGDDIIRGNDGRNRLIGGSGEDMLSGYAGGDRLYGGERSDSLYGGTGGDRLYGGSGDDRMSGGSGDDLLRAGLGDDRLVGGAGRDSLYGGGGAGSDVFVFGSSLSRRNFDLIGDWDNRHSRIELDADIFRELEEGELGRAFHSGTRLTNRDQHILYRTEDGYLIYDPDGTGARAGIHFATLEDHGGVEMSARDFEVIG